MYKLSLLYVGFSSTLLNKCTFSVRQHLNAQVLQLVVVENEAEEKLFVNVERLLKQFSTIHIR